MLAEIDITEKLKDPGLIQWFIYAYIALTIYDKVSAIVQKRKAADVRVVGGEMEVSQKTAFADKAETKKALEGFQKGLQSLTESLNTQHMAALKAGEDRVRNISEVMDSETKEVKHSLEQLSNKMDLLIASVHEKINTVALKLAAAEANIQNLQTEHFMEQTKKRRGTG